MLVLPRARPTMRPSPGAPVQTGHPLARGLIDYWDHQGGPLVSHVSGSNLAIQGSAAASPRGLVCDVAGKGAWLALPPRLQLTLPISIACRFTQILAPAGSASLFGLVPNNTAASPFASLFLGDLSTTTYEVYFSNGSTFGNVNTSAADTSAIFGVPQTWVLVYTAAGIRAYQNGVQVYSDSTARSTPVYGATATAFVGTAPGYTTNANIAAEWMGVWNAPLTQEDAQSLTRDPYAMFRPGPWRILVQGAGGGSTAPGAPTGLSATPGNTQMGLSWTAPASNGGSAITDYLVEYALAGSGSWSTFADGTSTSTSATVTGLTNGTSYDFRVSAINAIGTGTASSTATATPRTVPGAPTIGTATAGDTQASVTFSAPGSNGGSSITGYTVTSTPGSFTGSGASSPVTVPGLSNGTSYTFTVHATNAAGNSSESTASNSVTPSSVGQYLEDAILNWLKGTTFPAAPTTLYASLHTGDPGKTGAGEVIGGSYARVAITTWSPISSGTGNRRQISNAGALTFPSPTANWGTVGYFGLWDASSGGNCVDSNAITSGGGAVNNGDGAPSFGVGALVINVLATT